MFAKIFESEWYGQILVVRNMDDDGKPLIIFSSEPSDMGVCSVKITFNDTEEGWDELDELFENMNLNKAEEFVEPIYNVSSA